MVCFDAWCSMLGTGKRTALRMMHGDLDMRTVSRAAPS